MPKDKNTTQPSKKGKEVKNRVINSESDPKESSDVESDSDSEQQISNATSSAPKSVVDKKGQVKMNIDVDQQPSSSLPKQIQDKQKSPVRPIKNWSKLGLPKDPPHAVKIQKTENIQDNLGNENHFEKP